MINISDIYKYSEKHNMQHIPSAISMFVFVDILFSENIINPYIHNIIIGKPFGAQTYYVVFLKNNLIVDKEYSYGLKHDEIDFINFSDETLGNSLGIASGIEIANKKLTWCVLSDSQLQMGPILEAVQFIGRNQQNIRLVIDYNYQQLTSSLLTTLESDTSFFKYNNWTVVELRDVQHFTEEFSKEQNNPTVYFVLTKKE